MTTTGQQGSPVRFPSPQPHPFRPLLSTSWVPLDETIQAWASFGAQAASAPALSATGMAFLALSWETSALHHRTKAYQDRQRGRSRSSVRDLGQTMQDLSQAIRHWSQVALWLERLANDEHHPVEDLDALRLLLHLVQQQQQRVWTLTQEAQEDLQAYGQPVAQGLGHIREHGPGGDREEDIR
jgi:hypothetical protein